MATIFVVLLLSDAIYLTYFKKHLIKDMTSQEYEIQHFEFSAEQISLERQYVLKAIIQDLLKPVLDKLTTTESTSLLLAQQQSKVIQKIQEAFKEKIQEIEQLDGKNFSIPEHVLLLKDFDHVRNYKFDDEERLDEEIGRLKQLFLENSIMIAALSMENGQYESVETLLQAEIAVHSQVHSVHSGILKHCGCKQNFRSRSWQP